jgi:hypothetical protein
VPLDFDRRHSGSINLDYRTPVGYGPSLGDDVHPFEKTGLSLLFSFNSGIPYTKSVITNPFFGGVTEVRPLGTINGATTPWNFRMDLKLDRSFSLGPVSLVASLSVLNLLNADNVVSLDRITVPRNLGGGGFGIDNAGNIAGVYRGTGLPDNSGWLETQEGHAWIAANPTHEVNGVTYTDPVAYFKAREANPANFGIPRQVRLGLRVEY